MEEPKFGASLACKEQRERGASTAYSSTKVKEKFAKCSKEFAIGANMSY